MSSSVDSAVTRAAQQGVTGTADKGARAHARDSAPVSRVSATPIALGGGHGAVCRGPRGADGEQTAVRTTHIQCSKM